MLKNMFGRNKFYLLIIKKLFVSRAIWESNLKTVQEHNLKADIGVYTFWLGMNKFADLVKFYRYSYKFYSVLKNRLLLNSSKR